MRPRPLLNDLAGYKLWAERGFAILKAGGWLPWR